MIKVAVLDDYQSAFEEIVDIEKFKNKFDFKIFNEAFNDENEAIEALEEFEVLFIMRERTPITKGLLETSKDFLKDSKGSFVRTLIYTVGHFVIAITCLMLIANVSFLIALTDAIIEPLANSIWYFILDKWWTKKNKSL